MTEQSCKTENKVPAHRSDKREKHAIGTRETNMVTRKMQVQQYCCLLIQVDQIQMSGDAKY